MANNGSVRGSMIVSKSYAVSEDEKHSVVGCLYSRINTFAKMTIDPASSHSIFNTILFGVLFFLLSLLTEYMDRKYTWAIWTISIVLLLLFIVTFR